ncbi:MAG: nitroreductase family protein [Candidatus Cloacimonetes bacterium]|nr:nitroreductase family protein [Candidatus Cloacimonadota bacterium]
MEELAQVRWTLVSPGSVQRYFRLRRALHRIEKGLVAHPRRPGAGMDTVTLALDDLQDPEVASRLSKQDRSWSLAVLQQYAALLQLDLNLSTALKAQAERLLLRLGSCVTTLTGENPLHHMLIRDLPSARTDTADLKNFFTSRHSVRSFTTQPLSDDTVFKALEFARHSPSACNRQATGVVIVRDATVRRQVLELQGGATGYVDRMPTLLVLVGDRRGYPNYNERHTPYVDSALFGMNLIWGLLAHGVHSVCLNWSYTTPRKDRDLHRILKLDPRQRVAFVIAAGYAAGDALIPRSTKRDAKDFILGRF